MAYSELVKNFAKIRDYMREFYVYGFRSRDEFTKKSARSYDDERRRVESWLGDYMRFRQSADGKNVFISIDSRESQHNPLYKAWKTKSFTDGDITLHFILFDILSSPDVSLTLGEITEKIDGYLCGFGEPKVFDESTVRKKLKEYAAEGLIKTEKRGKTAVYCRTEDIALPSGDVIDFFSEVSPCGVIGSFLLDKAEDKKDHFSFKHHYITSAMDSDILCEFFSAMREKRYAELVVFNRRTAENVKNCVVPLRVMISAQNGRQYIMAYSTKNNMFTAYRIDYIQSVELGNYCDDYDRLRTVLDEMEPHIWGANTQSTDGSPMEHVEFTVRFDEYETFIPQRLEREKRCGKVEHPRRVAEKFSCSFAFFSNRQNQIVNIF